MTDRVTREKRNIITFPPFSASLPRKHFCQAQHQEAKKTLHCTANQEEDKTQNTRTKLKRTKKTATCSGNTRSTDEIDEEESVILDSASEAESIECDILSRNRPASSKSLVQNAEASSSILSQTIDSATQTVQCELTGNSTNFEFLCQTCNLTNQLLQQLIVKQDTMMTAINNLVNILITNAKCNLMRRNHWRS